ncbi:HIT domain-containing protein [Halobacterium sp. KA-4]|uniref:HIT family protein n=1 Tax=Halobacterium sp. KA-4 TaxID=2896367 RepID=UPI001E3EFA3A|nr:HIT domain-containing protein [Halobacterium sp. KA-4]MCD2201699.1 HIT domain-containing protein [Halobacterium sp. KA-4]
MEKIFAPWRMDWVSRDNRNDEFDGCVFCAIAESETDREHRVIARNQHAFAVLNKAPYNPGHLLIIPDDHKGDLTDLSASVVASAAILQQQAVDAMNRALSPDGFNTGMNIGSAGGASITDHVHIHIVPRWHSDTTFMPTTANTTVIVEALDESYDRLHDAFQELESATYKGDDAAIQLETPVSEKFA